MFTLSFDFERGEEDSLEQLNASLSSMRLSSLNIKDSDGYLLTKTTFKDGIPTGKSYSYGFDRIELECRQEDGEELYAWQIDAEAFPAGEIATSDSYHDRWCARHPGRVMRTLTQIGFDTADAFVVTHHERKA